MRTLPIAFLLCVAVACSGPARPITFDDAGSVRCRGSALPGSVIDADDPHYSDATFTEAQVRQMFADAKAANSSAYRAYRAARLYTALIQCGFCTCGCANLGHISNEDCFKTMHGFS